MKKLIFTFMALLTMVSGANATTDETTLWEGTYTGGVEINSTTVATLQAGDVLRVYVTVPEGGANFKICYKGDSNSWTETAIPSITSENAATQWPWVDGGNTYKDFTLTSEDISALSGMNIYIYKGENSTINKVSHIVTGESLWTGSVSTGDWGSRPKAEGENPQNMVALSYDDKGSLANARINDYIMVTYNVTASGAQVYIQNPNGWTSIDGQDDDSYNAEGTNTGKTYKLTISSASNLEIIQQNGILVRGKNITITNIDLFKPSNRYDAVPLTIGEDGIATFGSSKNLDFSSISGVTPYYASEVSTGTVTLKSVEKTRAWAGYIVQGTAGTYSIPVASSEPDWVDAFHNLRYTGDYDGNLVYRSAYSDYSGGGDNETKIKTYYRYIFAKKNSTGEIGFYKLTTDHTLAAHKAYLETQDDITPANARVALIFDNSEPTAIKNVNEWNTEDFIYYNLNGVRVQNPTKGLYIVNGKKVLVR